MGFWIWFALLVIAAFSPQGHTTQKISLDKWGLRDIQLPRLKTDDKKEILIAVIDTGIDETHPDLAQNLWQNPGETGFDQRGRNKAGNGIDDDQNGFVDDVYGWDFVRQNPKPRDQHGHGTHIAGLIHQIAPQAKLMILKYYDPKLRAVDTIKYTASAFEYAAKMGAQIINYSGGGSSQSREEFQALEVAKKLNVLVVAAAGNEGQNSDIKPYYPANYDLSHILSVTAHNPKRQLLETSNFGANNVDLSAPGEHIWSTMPGGGYGLMTGTSQATALATGVAALTLSQNFFLKTPEEVIQHLILTGALEPAQQGKTRQARRLDAQRALYVFDSWPQGLFGTAEDNRPTTLNRGPSSPPTLKELTEQLAQKLSRPTVNMKPLP
ncbi:MAG: S8 family peptidase [Bdellovibrionales bacterium]